MTIGHELDLAFNEMADKETVLGIEATLTSQIERLETELTNQIVRVAAQSDPTDRIAELVNDEVNERMNGDIAALESRVTDCENDMNFDPDDLRCDFESQIENLEDSISYESDRIDDIECYKITEEEAEYIVDRKLDDRFDEALTDAVCEEINSRAVSWTEHRKLQERVLELEARLNKPSFTARALRWLREGPSIKEVATNWYAGIRRGS